MNRSEPLTLEKLRQMADMPGPCVTIVIAASQANQLPIELKGAINQAQSKLRKRGTDGESLIGRIRDAARDLEGEVGSFAILGSQSMMEVLRVDGSIPALVHIGDRFDIRTLLAIIESQKHFHVLGLSQKRSRLLKCNQQSCEEVPLPPDVAVSLAEATQTEKPDHVLDNRSAGGPSTGGMGGVTFGTSTDREHKDEYLLHFFTQLDRGVHAILKGSREPLVPVGVEREIALYRRVNSYPHLVEPGVFGAVDGLEGAEVHKRALELVSRQAREPGNDIPADFDKRVGTDHASKNIQEIMEAAFEGRVSHLFLQPNATYIGTFDRVRSRVKQTADPLESPCDLLENAAWQTIMHAGVVRMLPATSMPNGVPVCALFRYPAPSKVATAAPAESTA